jgi:rsbT co-antagonist protein RsbR
MNDELEKYRSKVESQEQELLDLLASIGLGCLYDTPVRTPTDDEPLANLFVGLKLAADNLQMLSNDLELRIRQAEERAATISTQQQAIRELSTPVFEVWEGVVVLPLVGTIDTARAGQITTSLLDSIVRKQAAVVIIDITGVPLVDTTVANHLLNSVEASKLLGAEVVLTGVGPHIAQSLVSLGVDLSNVTTKGSLMAGLKWALGRLSP